MRKMMSKEVTYTTLSIAKMTVVDGEPKAEKLPDVKLIGNIKLEKAQKLVKKKYGQDVTVFSVSPETKIYEMEVERFIELATEKQK